MTAPLVKGWCPSLGTPMESGDGWIVRVKPPGSRLSADQIRTLAAAQAGNGRVDLTARANIQFRGFARGAIGEFAGLAVSLGLGLADPAAEQVRNVMVAPLAGERALAVARALEAALATDEALHRLPPKFGFAVAGDGGLPIPYDTADITIDVDAGQVIVPRAPSSSNPLLPGGEGYLTAVAAPDLLATALSLAHTFLHQMSPSVRRMRAASIPGQPWQPLAPAQPIGALPGGAIIGLPFGQTGVRELVRFADLAAAASDGVLHLCPWRAIAIRGDADALLEGAQRLGLVTDPMDPRLRIVSCTGKPACPHASVPTRADADWAARMDLVPAGAMLHLSGCSKGCAHPLPATAVLTGRGGLYDLILSGRADARPLADGLTLDDAADLLTSLLESRL